MHEFSIAAEMVDNVLEFSRAHPDVEMLSVRVQIGELTCIEPEQLCFCYESITRQTPLEGSQLEIETVKAIVRCRRCGYEGSPVYWNEAVVGVGIATMQCPECGSSARPVQGHECLLRTVQVVTRDHPEPSVAAPLPITPGLS